MPATQRGQVDGRPGRYRLRWYDRDGKRHSKQPFSSRSAAWGWFREHVEPALASSAPVRQDPMFSEFASLFLSRHAADVRPRTVRNLAERLRYAERRFGEVRMRELERMAEDIAAWRVTLPERSRYGITQALRQALGAAQRWGYITRNPAVDAGRNPQPSPRSVRVYTREELEAIAVEMSRCYRSLPAFMAATGLRPEEWQALERRDVDRRAGVLHVRRTVSSGEIVELGKTSRSRRQVPLSPRALAALDALPPRLDTALLFPSPDGRVLHLNNFRNREWIPAVGAAGIRRPARIYDCRHTFASTALAAGVTTFELAKIMGTSVMMIERVYGALLDGAVESIAARLGAFELTQVENA